MQDKVGDGWGSEIGRADREMGGVGKEWGRAEGVWVNLRDIGGGWEMRYWTWDMGSGAMNSVCHKQGR